MRFIIRFLGLLSLGLAAANGQADEVKRLEGETVEKPVLALKAMEEWVATERQLSEEKLSLVAQRAEEERLKELYRAELEAIQKQVKAAGSAHEQDMEGLRQDQEFVKQAKSKSQDMRDSLVKQSQRIQALHPSLPEVLRDQLELELKQLTTPEVDLKDVVIASTKYLQKVAKFNQSITYAEEFHEINGQEKQLEILYLGLGGAYFVSGDLAGTGLAGTDGWQWLVQEKAASEAKRALAIFKKNARPDLVKLPVRIQK